MKRNPLSITPCLFALCCVCGFAAPLTPANKPSMEEIQASILADQAKVAEVHANIVYKKVGGREVVLDLLLPPNRIGDKGNPPYPDGTPIAVYLHGGGWVGGGYRNHKTAPFFMEHGVAVAQVRYRLAGVDGNTMETCVIDSFDALRFLAKNAKQYGLDPSRIVVFGASAGGHLTLMTVLADPAQFTGDPALADATFRILGGAALCPPVSFVDPDLVGERDYVSHPERQVPKMKKLFGDVPYEQTYDLRKKLSPLYWLKKDSPRVIILHGESDATVSIKGSVKMSEKAREIGADLYLVREPDAGHNFQGVRPPLLRAHRQIFLENLLDMIRNSCGKSDWSQNQIPYAHI